MTSPLIFSLPLMNSFCAFALPEMSLAKSRSERMSVTVIALDVSYEDSVTLHGSGNLRCSAPYFDIVLRIIVLPPAFSPSGAVPLPRVPVFLRSIYQLSWLFSAFLSVKAKMAPPFLTASFFSASSERASRIKSKAAEEGYASVRDQTNISDNISSVDKRECQLTVLERHSSGPSEAIAMYFRDYVKAGSSRFCQGMRR